MLTHWELRHQCACRHTRQICASWHLSGVGNQAIGWRDAQVHAKSHESTGPTMRCSHLRARAQRPAAAPRAWCRSCRCPSGRTPGWMSCTRPGSYPRLACPRLHRHRRTEHSLASSTPAHWPGRRIQLVLRHVVEMLLEQLVKGQLSSKVLQARGHLGTAAPGFGCGRPRNRMIAASPPRRTACPACGCLPPTAPPCRLLTGGKHAESVQLDLAQALATWLEWHPDSGRIWTHL